VKLLPGSRRGALWRFTLGAVVVIGFTATTTAVAGLLQFKQLASDIARSPAIRHAQVTIANPGTPQTLLLIGSDHRAGQPWRAANTDTMMLVRLDPNSATINLLSVPRDLEVQIPEGGALVTGRLNAAYSIGGPNLLVRVLRQQVFPGIQVNHIVDVNFGGFRALVNALGCVYVDVDHRYYNNTAYTGYSSIDLQPGYQKLCGSDALAFVRFRHTDSDLVRNARQQDFLRWVKSEFSASYLVGNRDSLLRVFGQHTQTDADLHSVDGLINLFNLVAFSAGHTFKQIPFPAIFLPCGAGAAFGANPAGGANGGTPCYVAANGGAERRAFGQFMAATPPQVPAPATAAGGAGPSAAGPGHAPAPTRINLTRDLSDSRGQAATLRRIGMPVYYPQLIASGSSYCSTQAGFCPALTASSGAYPRSYLIHDQTGGSHVAYRMTIELNPALGEYYGIQGTTWQTPPILSNPSETRVVGGKQLLLYFNAHKLSLAAWRTPQGVYWVSNTLTDSLSNAQMLGIAASLRRG
jgi:polyisoprenyl-teichoic acid--peptidoglycan teichoic acid transferase